MQRRISETQGWSRLNFLRFLGVLSVLAILVVPSVASAQDILLNRAFGELQAERYERALSLLDRALPKADNSADRAKVNYYRGFALEKLGQCETAELAYRRVLGVGGKLDTFASDALEGFDGRCVAAGEPRIGDTRSVEMSRGSGRVGWKVFGWTTMIVGGLTLAAIPVKKAVEGEITSQAEPYFLLQYNCVVDNGAVSGERCDRDALDKDLAYQEYEDTRDEAQKWTDVMIYSGAGLAAIGLTTIIAVAVTRPSADAVTLSVGPTNGGAMGSATIRF